MDSIRWNGEALALLDQSALPQKEVWITCADHLSAAVALAGPAVPGGPAAGIAAAYAYCLAAKAGGAPQTPAFEQALDEAATLLNRARPEEAHVTRALSRMEALRRTHGDSPGDLMEALLAEAVTIHRQDILANRALGRFGADLLPEQARILLHGVCADVAAGGFAQALSIARIAWRRGKLEMVYLTEGRPTPRNAALAAWELAAEDIPCTTVADSAAAGLMADRQVHLVLAGSGFMSANGDLLAPAGTYAAAICAYYHGLPFYAALPHSGIDPTIPDGAALRAARQEMAPGLSAAFDLTPCSLISGVITEKGIVYPPFQGE